MINFTKSEWTNLGVAYIRYTADRKRGGGTWVFYNSVPTGYTYDPTWPHDIDQDAAFTGLVFRSYIQEDNIHVDFRVDLNTPEETALDALYTAHVAPVVIP